MSLTGATADLTEDTAKILAQRIFNSMKTSSQTRALELFNAARNPFVRPEAKNHLQSLINDDVDLRTLFSGQSLSQQGGRRKSNRRRSKRSRRSRRNKRR